MYIHKKSKKKESREINEKVLDDKYSLPNIADVLDKLGKC